VWFSRKKAQRAWRFGALLNNTGVRHEMGMDYIIIVGARDKEPVRSTKDFYVFRRIAM
jgi:hypothetical protein